MGKVAIVTMVRNECDIIELFLRINLRHADHIFVMDHNSDDGTCEILSRIEAEGAPVTCTTWADPQFNQGYAMTMGVRQIARTGHFDYIVPLDADEFLSLNDPTAGLGRVLDETLPANGAGLAPWRTYCPISDGYDAAVAPLHELFRGRSREPGQLHKVVMGADFARNCAMGDGNHWAESPPLAPPDRNLPIKIQHVPIRSSAQITCKAILGSHTLSRKQARGEREGWHWDDMAQRIRANGFRVTEADLTAMAANYACETAAADMSIDLGSERIGLPDDCIRYRDLARIDVLASFDRYIRSLTPQAGRG